MSELFLGAVSIACLIALIYLTKWETRMKKKEIENELPHREE